MMTKGTYISFILALTFVTFIQHKYYEENEIEGELFHKYFEDFLGLGSLYTIFTLKHFTNRPMEEQRQRYGPPLYSLTTLVRSIRIFLFLSWRRFEAKRL